jgi:hypothetical protein
MQYMIMFLERLSNFDLYPTCVDLVIVTACANKVATTAIENKFKFSDNVFVEVVVTTSSAQQCCRLRCRQDGGAKGVIIFCPLIFKTSVAGVKSWSA